MALYRIEVKYRLLQFEAGNRFYVQADSAAEASNYGQSIVGAMRAMVSTAVEFYRMRISTAAQDGRRGLTVDFSLNGQKTVNTRLPPNECVMLKFQPFGETESMNFKYIRWAVSATEQTDGVISNLTVTALQNQASGLLLDAPIYTAKGTVLSSVQVDSRLHSRDLHRAWGDRTPKEGVGAGA